MGATKRRAAPTLLIAVAFLSCLTQQVKAGELHACFVPEYHGGPTCTDQIVAALAGAQKSILVQAYGFTSAPIAKALVDAHKRGVEVRVILDKSNRTQQYSSATFLQNMGIPPVIDAQHAIAHNKVMVIDGHEVVTGSFNFTKAAEAKNGENVVFIDDDALAKAYAQNWQDHAAHSVAGLSQLRDGCAAESRGLSECGSRAGGGVSTGQGLSVNGWSGTNAGGERRRPSS